MNELATAVAVGTVVKTLIDLVVRPMPIASHYKPIIALVLCIIGAYGFAVVEANVWLFDPAGWVSIILTGIGGTATAIGVTEAHNHVRNYRLIKATADEKFGNISGKRGY